MPALTISKAASQAGLSRTALLYYESIGLVRASGRTSNGYRRYAEKDLARLRQVCIYREAGLRLKDIRQLLDGPQGAVRRVLERRLAELNGEIRRLREHQMAIARMLRHKEVLKDMGVMNKDKWVAVLRQCGFTEEDMHRWHAEFERMEPQGHQEFLEYLGVTPDDIQAIRQWSRAASAG